MRFIFVRHGRTHFNEINLTQGWCDSPLCKTGILEVENIANELKAYKINRAYTSPLGRAVQTADIILRGTGLQAVQEERFKEVNFGILEGISTELVKKLKIESPNWLEDLDMNYKPFAGENLNDVIIKHREALDDIIKSGNENDTILIAGHGCSLYGFIRSLLPDEQFLPFPNNGTAIIVDYINDEFFLERILNPTL